jgi:hypothetical protein
MDTLARFAAILALLGGAVWVIANLIQLVAPLSYAWIGLFASGLLIGGAALGLQRQFGQRTGMLGRWGGLATAAGSVGVVTALLLLIATGQINTDTTGSPILQALILMSLLLFFAGSLVFALGLMRAKAISPIAGWLVVLGAVVIPVLVIVVPQNPPPIVYLPLAIYGIGWVLVGYEARTPMAEVGIAGQAS